ncbi:hypothetical protein [Pseudofrankia sp. BMG5.36]|uniref:hypothetical protein n=1 Tax=Pseudofrankia sp. BMG5.36 TaxID=1834512 RepID=UPI001F526DB3|nr:hypothetical protein [Pseudofrankia sp. BMG5.36]
MAPRPRTRARGLRAGRRAAVQAALVTLLTATAVVLAERGTDVPKDKAEVLWQLGFGIFSTILTAHTIVFAVSADAESVWPSFTDVVIAIALPEWLVVGLASILVASAGDIGGDPDVINAGLALVSIQSVLGIYTLLKSLQALGGEGRRRFLANLATRDLRRAARRGNPVRLKDKHLIEDYLSGVETAIDRGDVASLSQRAAEIGLYCRADSDPRVARWRLALLTYLVERIGRAVLYDNLTGDAARVALPQLIDGTLQSSYRLAELTLPAGAASDLDSRVTEVESAVSLGQVCRVIGWLQQAAHELLQQEPGHVGARQIIASVQTGRKRIVQFVDPDPPGFFREHGDPWPAGLSDPRAVLVWLWALCEFGGSWVGSGLYILAEVLTGEKFYGNYWHGDCVITEIERRIGQHGQHPHRRRDRKTELVLRACGGLDAISLELAATVIAGLRNWRFTAPPGYEQDPAFSSDRRYLKSQLSMFSTHDCLPNAEAAFDWLARTLSDLPTEPSLWRLVQADSNRWGLTEGLDLYGPADRPAAAVLTSLIRLLTHRPAEARRLADLLPLPLLGGALQLARFALATTPSAEPVMLTWSADGHARLGPRQTQVDELIGILEAVMA